MIVIDASIAVKWFYPEIDSDKADAVLRSGEKLIAPELIRIEVAAAFTRFLRMGTLDEQKTQILLDQWQRHLARQVLSLEATTTDFKAATTYSMQLRHPLQDCLYLAVAKRLKAPLITADKKLIEKVQDVAHHDGFAVKSL
jgi:predicted nucleic acid-binding protein